MNSFGGATCLGGVQMYNQAIDSGEIAGEKLEARLWPLPTPYNPANMKSEVYSIRPIYLQIRCAMPSSPTPSVWPTLTTCWRAAKPFPNLATPPTA